jgi:hypothetical protein
MHGYLVMQKLMRSRTFHPGVVLDKKKEDALVLFILRISCLKNKDRFFFVAQN